MCIATKPDELSLSSSSNVLLTLLRARPAITMHSVSEKIDSIYQPKLFFKAQKISLASKYLVL